MSLDLGLEASSGTGGVPFYAKHTCNFTQTLIADNIFFNPRLTIAAKRVRKTARLYIITVTILIASPFDEMNTVNFLATITLIWVVKGAQSSNRFFDYSVCW